MVGTFVVALALFAGISRDDGRPAAQTVAQSIAGTTVGPPARTLDGRIAQLQATARAQPRRADTLSDLGVAYLQKVRETADPAFYTRAEGVLRRALALKPADPTALTGLAQLTLGRHDFHGGLMVAQRAHRAEPDSPAPYGAIVDANVELGRYGAAERALQKMVDLRPNLASYARVSYFRELHGDLAGASSAMSLAVSAGAGAPENVAYVQALLGNLEFTRGRLGPANAAYRRALAGLPRYPPALIGLAQVAAARGDLTAAIRRYRPVVERLPLPAYVIAMGEAQLAAGQRRVAARTLSIVEVERRLLQANGVNVDVELALFEADHGSPRRAVAFARKAWANGPSVRSADARSWALTRDGRPAEGLRWARRALRLGWREPLVLYHGGVAARAAGDRTLARRWLRRSVASNPRFSPLYGPRARRTLRAL